MHSEYRWLLQRAATDPAVRVLVVTGTGADSAPGRMHGRSKATSNGAPTTTG